MMMYETAPVLDLSMAELFATVAAISPDEEGVTRPAFSETETAVLDYLSAYARDAGLEVETDDGQNRLFCLPEDKDADRWVLVGSHVDSVPQGGNYDGLAGVAAGLYCLLRARSQGQTFPRPVKVIALRAEESAWFGPCYIGSKLLTGTIAGDELDATHKGDGRPLLDHVADIGIDRDAVRRQQPLENLDRILAYIELHIEQGPLLIEKGLPAAIVSGIRGNVRFKDIRCLGEAGHSGAVPRAYRHDAVLAMCDLLTRLDDSWQTILQKGEDLVLTAGMVGTNPATHALSRIPELASFSLDIRSQSEDVLDQMYNLLFDEFAVVSQERGVTFEPGAAHRTAPALMDPALTEGLRHSLARVNNDAFLMPSGGGHDAAVFANVGIPSGMVFVRNANGSHNPNEAMDLKDFTVGANAIFDYLSTVPS